jgi:glycosyltransferase involved in cell wall biosynthesis
MNSSEFLPNVSVIVPIFNGEKDLPDLMDCLCNQTYPGDRVEYLLVDNASNDNTATIIQQEALIAKDRKIINIRYLTENRIQSSYAARNAGILESNGEILAFTDIDCRPQSDWLHNLIQPFADPVIGIVGGAIKALPGKTLFEKYAEYQKILSQEAHLSHQFLPYAATANIAIRRQTLEEIGLFRPYLTTGGDADICWRIQKQSSWQLYYALKAIVQHRHRASLKGLLMQHHRYGRGIQYLNELYDIEISPETRWNTTKYLRSWKHWLIKELPLITTKMMLGKASFLDLLITPITILVQQSLAIGRLEAKLSEETRQIQKI